MSVIGGFGFGLVIGFILGAVYIMRSNNDGGTLA